MRGEERGGGGRPSGESDHSPSRTRGGKKCRVFEVAPYASGGAQLRRDRAREVRSMSRQD